MRNGMGGSFRDSRSVGKAGQIVAPQFPRIQLPRTSVNKPLVRGAGLLTCLQYLPKVRENGALCPFEERYIGLGRAMLLLMVMAATLTAASGSLSCAISAAISRKLGPEAVKKMPFLPPRRSDWLTKPDERSSSWERLELGVRERPRPTRQRRDARQGRELRPETL
jgi:hypothetical protein